MSININSLARPVAPTTSCCFFLDVNKSKMAGIGVAVVVAVVTVVVVKFLITYLKNLRFNSLVHSPGLPVPVSDPEFESRAKM